MTPKRSLGIGKYSLYCDELVIDIYDRKTALSYTFNATFNEDKIPISTVIVDETNL